MISYYHKPNNFVVIDQLWLYSNIDQCPWGSEDTEVVENEIV